MAPARMGSDSLRIGKEEKPDPNDFLYEWWKITLYCNVWMTAVSYMVSTAIFDRSTRLIFPIGGYILVTLTDIPADMLTIFVYKKQ